MINVKWEGKAMRAIALSAFGVFVSCLLGATTVYSSSVSDRISELPAADLIFSNGKIHTVDSDNRIVQAIAVKNGVIIALGPDESVLKHIVAETRVIDLEGKVLLPGLIDAHMHPVSAGGSLRACSLGYASLTVDEILARITTCLDEEAGEPDESWLSVQAWFRQATKPAGADLSAEILDKLPTKRPVIVLANDYHTMAANSAAIAAAGVTGSTQNPSDGLIVRDPDGEATGIFLDGAMGMLTSAIPELSDVEKDQEALLDLTAALDAIAKQGVTTVFSASTNAVGMKAFQALRNSDRLTVRARFSHITPPDEARDPQKVVDGIKALGERFNTTETAQRPGMKMDRAKIFVDGVIQAPAQTGALLEPYLQNTGTESDPHWVPGDNTGALYYDEQLLTELLDTLVTNGLTAHLHTTGDGSVRTALNAIETVRRTHESADFFRPGLAHCELVSPSDLVRFGQLDALPVLSFQWHKRGPDTIDSVEKFVGPERFLFQGTGGKLVQAGARVAFGSDWPIEPLDEWLAMQIAITRKNPDKSNPNYQDRLGDDPGLDINTAIRAFTINAAYHLNMDNSVGSLEVGKFADMIVIDKDITAIDPDDIKDTNVLLTVLGGREIYRDASF